MKYSWLTMFQVHIQVIQLLIYTYIIFQIIFHYRLLHDIVYSSLCDTIKLCCLLYIYFCNQIYSILLTLSQTSWVKISNFLFRKKIINFLRYIYIYIYILQILFIYMYMKTVLLCLIKVWERTSKKSRRDGEIWKQKLNEMRNLKTKAKWNEYEIEKMKPTR